MSGCAFRFQHFHHLVGGGGGSVLFEIAGNHKDGVPPAYLGHAIRAAGGSGGASVGGVGHRLSFLFSSILRHSIFACALASSVWAFADIPGLRGVDSANYAVVFLPLLLTTHGKANLAKFPGISFRVFVTEFDKNGKISSVLQ